MSSSGRESRISPPEEDSEEAALSDGIEAVRDLLGLYHREVVPGFRRADRPETQAVQAALLVRSPPLAEAVLTLAEAGFGREAMMLNRPLFELMLDAGWAGSQPAPADERFLAHARYTQHLRQEVFRRYPELGVTPPTSSLGETEIKASRQLFGRFGDRSWTGLTTRERVEVFASLLDVKEKRQLWFFFDVLHDQNNDELHPSSRSLARALRRVPNEDGSYQVQFRAGRERELAAVPLGFTWWVFVHLLGLMYEVTKTPPDSLRATVDKGADLLGLRDSQSAT